jgi:transcriptional regulator with XRE-family HTH domain
MSCGSGCGAGSRRSSSRTAAEVESRYVQEIERGRTNLSLAVLVALANALGVDERTLLKPAKLSPPRAGRPPRSPSR